MPSGLLPVYNPKEVELNVKEFLRELFYRPKRLERPGRMMDQYQERDLFNLQARPDAPTTRGGDIGSVARFVPDAIRESLRVAGRVQDKIDTAGGNPPKETEVSTRSLKKDIAWESVGLLTGGAGKLLGATGTVLPMLIHQGLPKWVSKAKFLKAMKAGKIPGAKKTGETLLKLKDLVKRPHEKTLLDLVKHSSPAPVTTEELGRFAKKELATDLRPMNPIEGGHAKGTQGFAASGSAPYSPFIGVKDNLAEKTTEEVVGHELGHWFDRTGRAERKALPGFAADLYGGGKLSREINELLLSQKRPIPYLGLSPEVEDVLTYDTTLRTHLKRLRTHKSAALEEGTTETIDILREAGDKEAKFGEYLISGLESVAGEPYARLTGKAFSGKPIPKSFGKKLSTDIEQAWPDLTYRNYLHNISDFSEETIDVMGDVGFSRAYMEKLWKLSKGEKVGPILSNINTEIIKTPKQATKLLQKLLRPHKSTIITEPQKVVEWLKPYLHDTDTIGDSFKQFGDIMGDLTNTKDYYNIQRNIKATGPKMNKYFEYDTRDFVKKLVLGE